MSDLAELFSRDPRRFTGPTDPDLLALVKRLRESRSQWNLGVKPTKKTAAKAPAVELDLKDLGL